jgi:hypothetical protein
MGVKAVQGPHDGWLGMASTPFSNTFLEGVANDDPELNWTVMQTLASYVRRRSPLPRDIFKFDGANRTYRLTDQEIEEKLRSLDPTTDDIQVALDVLSKTYQI